MSQSGTGHPTNEAFEGFKSKDDEYNIVKLPAEFISAHWDQLRDAILASLPPTCYPTYEVANRILQSLLGNHMQCWVVTHEHESKSEIKMVATTRIAEEPCTGIKNMVIFSLYGFGRIPDAVWQRWLIAFKKFAYGAGCYKILAYTNSSRVEQLAEQLSGRKGWSLIEWEV